MMKRQLNPKKAEQENLNEALAVLIASTKSKKRPLPLTEIAGWLDIAVASLGSYQAVADRISLSPKMLKQFYAVKSLSPPARKLFENRKLDSVDAAVHLAMLPAKEQKTVSEALAAKEIDTADVRAIVQLRQIKRKDPIKKLLETVIGSRTKKEYIAEFVIRGHHNCQTMMAEFQKHIPKNEIVRLEIQGSIGRLVLTRIGKQALHRTAHKLGIPAKHIIPRILESQH